MKLSTLWPTRIPEFAFRASDVTAAGGQKPSGIPGTKRARWGFQFSLRFVIDAVERLEATFVKRTMGLVRAMLYLLLSALWVLAAEHGLAEPLSVCANGCGRSIVTAEDHGGHAPLKDVRTCEQSARLQNRRLGTQTGWGGVPAPVISSARQSNDLEHVAAPLTVSTAALELAKRWQFYWRTAPEPRAPSSVS